MALPRALAWAVEVQRRANGCWFWYHRPPSTRRYDACMTLTRCCTEGAQGTAAEPRTQTWKAVAGIQRGLGSEWHLNRWCWRLGKRQEESGPFPDWGNSKRPGRNKCGPLWGQKGVQRCWREQHSSRTVKVWLQKCEQLPMHVKKASPRSLAKGRLPLPLLPGAFRSVTAFSHLGHHGHSVISGLLLWEISLWAPQPPLLPGPGDGSDIIWAWKHLVAFLSSYFLFLTKRPSSVASVWGWCWIMIPLEQRWVWWFRVLTWEGAALSRQGISGKRPLETRLVSRGKGKSNRVLSWWRELPEFMI